MQSVIAVILLAGFIGSMCFMFVSLHRSMQFDLVGSSGVRENDNDSAAESFTDLLSKADRVMILYDNGNFMPDSIYHSGRIVESVERKLDRSPGFQLKCLFNEDCPELQFRQLAKRQNVDIRILSEGREQFPEHYKITDDGDRAYLSRHSRDSPNRRFRTVDCTSVPLQHRDRVKHEMLGKFLEHFGREFANARRVAA